MVCPNEEMGIGPLIQLVLAGISNGIETLIVTLEKTGAEVLVHYLMFQIGHVVKPMLRKV